MKTRLALMAVLLTGACATAEESEKLGGTEVFRIHKVTLPASFADVRRVAFDLDQNGTLDNAAGATLMSFFTSFDSAAETLPQVVNQALADERVRWYVAVDHDPATGRAEVLAVYGQDAEAGDSIPATLFADVIGDWPITWTRPSGIAGEVVVRGGSLAGRIGFALPKGSLVALAEPMARYFSAKLQAGELEMTALMDEDEDGVITVDEFLAFELVERLLAPDVDLIAADRELDSWSAAFDIEAVALGLEVPSGDPVE